MAIKQTLSLFFLSLFFPSFIFAQDSLVLDWEQCRKIAFKNNSSLKSKKLSIEEYRYKYLAGLNDYYPKISLSHSLRRSGGDSGVFNTVSAGISASEKIFDLRTISSIKIRKFSYEKMILNYALESSSLRYELSNAFMTLLVAQEKISVSSKIAIMREKNARLLKLKYESGRESRGNAMYSNALYEKAKADLIRSKRALSSARRKFAQYLNLPLNSDVKVKGDFRVPDSLSSFKEAMDIIEKTPRIMSLKKDIESAKERKFSAKYDLYPTLSASQSMSWSGNTEFPSSRSWSLGLSLSLPVFSSGITHYSNNVKASGYYLKGLKEKLKDEISSIKNDLAAAFDDFLNAVDAARTQEIMLEANEERYMEAQIKYMAGKISFIDLDNIEQNLVDARLNRLEYLKNTNIKKNSIDKLLGVELAGK